MDTQLDDFARDLAALTQRFLDLGARLGDAARGLAEAGAPPSDTLVEALGEGRTQFIQLRRDVMAAAGDAEVATTVDPESLHDLEPILQAVGEALRARARLAGCGHRSIVKVDGFDVQRVILLALHGPSSIDK